MLRLLPPIGWAMVWQARAALPTLGYPGSGEVSTLILLKRARFCARLSGQARLTRSRLRAEEISAQLSFGHSRGNADPGKRVSPLKYAEAQVCPSPESSQFWWESGWQ